MGASVRRIWPQVAFWASPVGGLNHLDEKSAFRPYDQDLQDDGLGVMRQLERELIASADCIEPLTYWPLINNQNNDFQRFTGNFLRGN